jgi:hypothetical protein
MGWVAFLTALLALSLAIGAWLADRRAARLAQGRDVIFLRPGDLLVLALVMLAVPFWLLSAMTGVAALYVDYTNRFAQAALMIAVAVLIFALLAG